jgi:hypothetical protein
MGIYPKPVLERIEPSINALITRVEAYTDYVEPAPTIQIGEHGGDEPADEEPDAEEEGEG